MVHCESLVPRRIVGDDQLEGVGLQREEFEVILSMMRSTLVYHTTTINEHKWNGWPVKRCNIRYPFATQLNTVYLSRQIILKMYNLDKGYYCVKEPDITNSYISQNYQA